jgi:hypothetical protein
MFMRYFHLAILATTAASALSQSAHEETADMARQLAGDFDWDIQAEDGVASAGFGFAADNEETVSSLSIAIVASWQVSTDTVLSSASDRRVPPIPSPISVEFKFTAKVTAFSNHQ